MILLAFLFVLTYSRHLLNVGTCDSQFGLSGVMKLKHYAFDSRCAGDWSLLRMDPSSVTRQVQAVVTYLKSKSPVTIQNAGYLRTWWPIVLGCLALQVSRFTVGLR